MTPAGCITVLETPTNALETMNGILLNSNHRHVSTTYVSMFRVVRRRAHL
jgi:hypothetical protein